MKTLLIEDLPDALELGRETMEDIRGGMIRLPGYYAAPIPDEDLPPIDIRQGGEYRVW